VYSAGCWQVKGALILTSECPTLGTAHALRQLAVGRDAESWALVLRLHGADILSATRRILGDAALAEDACQETLLQIRDRAGQFRASGAHEDTAARNWIMRIACNTALHMLRQRKRSKKRDAASALNFSRSEAVEIDIDQQDELARRVRNELAELPEKQRRPLMLHFFAGLSYETLSAELGCNVGAARVRVHRALSQLRKRLASAGLLVSLAALYALLESAPLSAAEAVLSPERMMQWQNLLASSQTAAVNALSDGSLPAAIGYAAASLALCGSLAFSFSGSRPVERNPVPTPKVVHAAPEAAPKIEPGAPVMREQPRGTSGVSAVAAPMVAAPMVAAPMVKMPKAVPFTGRTSKVEASTTPFSSRGGNQEARALSRPGRSETVLDADEIHDGGLVSPLAQLRMLHHMQRELNLRVNSVFDAALSDGHGGRIFTESQASILRHCSEQQHKIAALLDQVALDMSGQVQ
jgi:RNA polymerase sigma-70 factor (ECF subfamily)